MTNQEILDNAPEGATHIDDEGAYFKRTKQGHTFWWVNQASWMPAESNRSTRSLVDISKNAELMIENKQLQECFDECYEELQLTRNDGDKRIAELEKVELETVTKTRKMFVANARKFGYSNSVGHTIQELQKWEQKLKEQGE